ncbi:MAG: ParB/RepB/Spo0J family partition protein [Pirellulaceae bacterium]
MPATNYRSLPVCDCMPLSQIRPIIERRVVTLMQSIRDIGLLQPVLACPHPDQPNVHGVFGGLHRLEAMRRLKKETIDAHYFPPELSIDQMVIRAMAENGARAAMNFCERADAVTLVMKETGLSAAAAGELCCMSPAEVSKCLSCVQDLEESVRLKLANANIGYSIVYELAKHSPEVQLRYVDDVVAGMTRDKLMKQLQAPMARNLHLRIDAPTSYEELLAELTERINRLKAHQKLGTPFENVFKLLD